MSPLPSKFVDRWQNRPDIGPQQGTVYWHLLLGSHPQLQKIVRGAQEKLSEFSDLHMTPLEWLHVTTLIAGSTDEISDDQMKQMIDNAALKLSKIRPITATLEHVYYHPEAIFLDIQPRDALMPILDAARLATRAALGRDGFTGTAASSWTPHVTLCYSTAQQPAEPIIAALGKRVPSCELTIDTLSLVIQYGSERLWNWQPVGSARLLGTSAP